MTLIDSSSIITSADQLLTTKFEFCFSKDHLVRMNDMPGYHLLRRVVEKNKNCVLDEFEFDQRIDFTNRAMLVNPPFIRTLLSLLIKKNEKADVVYWMSQPVLYDQLVFYYRAGLTESQIKSIRQFSTSKLEKSLNNFLFDMPVLALEGKHVNVRVFSDLEQFIESYTVFREITLSSLSRCFCILLFCELLAFSLFLCRCTHRFLKSYCIRLSIRGLLIGIWSNIRNKIVTNTIYWKTIFLDIVFQGSNDNRQLGDQ